MATVPGRDDFTARTFKIWNEDGKGYRTHIEIDGEDVSGAFDNLVITANVKEAVRVGLSPVLDEMPARDGLPVRLFVLPEARNLLIKHGWTPPGD